MLERGIHVKLYNGFQLSEAQHGFGSTMDSCETRLLNSYHTCITSSLDNRKQIDVIILDFSKAFGKMPHRRLHMKLDYYGIRGSTLH